MRPEELVELIGKMANILEDAIDDGNWNDAKKVLDMLDELYDTISDQ